MTDEYSDVYVLSKKEYETETQFEFRKEIYDNVYNDTKSQKDATIFSNIWVNILSMGCEYPREIMKKIEKYKPTRNIYE